MYICLSSITDTISYKWTEVDSKADFHADIKTKVIILTHVHNTWIKYPVVSN